MATAKATKNRSLKNQDQGVVKIIETIKVDDANLQEMLGHGTKGKYTGLFTQVDNLRPKHLIRFSATTERAQRNCIASLRRYTTIQYADRVYRFRTEKNNGFLIYRAS